MEVKGTWITVNIEKSWSLPPRLPQFPAPFDVLSPAPSPAPFPCPFHAPFPASFPAPFPAPFHSRSPLCPLLRYTLCSPLRCPLRSQLRTPLRLRLCFSLRSLLYSVHCRQKRTKFYLSSLLTDDNITCSTPLISYRSKICWKAHWPKIKKNDVELIYCKLKLLKLYSNKPERFFGFFVIA